MSRWCKRVFLWVTLVIGVVLLGCGGLMATPTTVVKAVDPNLISVPNAWFFVPPEWVYEDTIMGVFLTRATKPGTTYWGSVSAERIIDIVGDVQGFNPTYTALVKHNDVWQEVPRNEQGQCVGPFRIDSLYDDEQSHKRAIRWELDASAPAAVYGIKCAYPDPETPEIHESIFNIVYTDAWTYLTMFNDQGANAVTNFFGGRNRTLTVQVAFDDGATTPTLEPINQEIDNSGVAYGPIRNNEIISLDTLRFTLKTVGGETYDGIIDVVRIPGTNLVTLMFADELVKDTYILQLSSTVDDKIYGQLVINNAGRAAGINLSHIWVFFVVAGGFLVLAAAITFFLPLLMVKINANRVYKENTRIARMKNPEAYAAKSGTLFQRMQNKLQKFAKRKKGDEAAVAEDEKPQVEDVPVYKPKFTDMLRERRENRDFMQKSGQTETAKLETANNEANAKASFAFLRDDDDDEIASLKEEKEEISTIETGSYVQDGVTFAKLDSLQDENDENGQ